MKSFAFLLLALLCATALAQNVVGTIDDFEADTDAVVIVATTATNPQTKSDFTVDNSIVGGERDVQLTSFTGNNVVLSASVSEGLYSSAAPQGGTGSSLLQYDGLDASLNLDPSGLDDSDFTIAGGYAFRTNITADLPTTVTFRVYSGSATSFCQYDLRIPGSTVPTFFTLRYVDFNETGAGCDFTSIGAIEVQANLPDSVDVTIAVIEVIALPSATPTRSPTRTPTPSRIPASASNTPSTSRTPTPTRTPSSAPRSPTPTRTPSSAPRSPSNTPSPSSCICRCPELECFMFKYGETTFYGDLVNLERDVRDVEEVEDGFDFLKFF